ncbi:helix-turn-helix transcriptional regulator [Paraburkholderia sp. FT54]|uniref:helix-turn-helix domain-containing protein n=1 Tax=Paraburkholderia sp. FT54 TaxID=3074437 RepID=UPI002877D390|nr:helix-turn-helix transcriptional regulator [Paraburkholderia sp. FT54]WNC90907.1 helix-turn-helix transcriptional regulator [Paraburkholderia sp. FT54]WNC91064.1 helix-turn-helix transcriptional regulator [Paraburkholderia sp. FT54]
MDRTNQQPAAAGAARVIYSGGAMHDVAETIGARLRRLRTDARLSASEVARRIHMSQTYVCEVERNEHLPGLTMAADLAKLFGVSLDYIAGLTDREINPYVKYQ